MSTKSLSFLLLTQSTSRRDRNLGLFYIWTLERGNHLLYIVFKAWDSLFHFLYLRFVRFTIYMFFYFFSFSFPVLPVCVIFSMSIYTLISWTVFIISFHSSYFIDFIDEFIHVFLEVLEHFHNIYWSLCLMPQLYEFIRAYYWL